MSLCAAGLIALRMRFASQVSSVLVAGTANSDSLFEASLTPEGLLHRNSGAPIDDDSVDDCNQSQSIATGHTSFAKVVRAEKQSLGKKAVQFGACRFTSHVIACDPVVFNHERTSALAVLQLSRSSQGLPRTLPRSYRRIWPACWD